MRAVRASVLASGSRGNAVFIESADASILIDCGLTMRDLKARLESLGQDVKQLKAIFITHDHGDHVGSSVALSRRMKIPVYATAGTHSILGELPAGMAQILSSDVPIDLGPFEVFPIATPHDGIESVAYRVLERESSRAIGIATDLGYASRQVVQRMAGVHTLVAEHNHDEEMLIDGPYPWPVKQRIRGGRGHLSNAQGAALASHLSHSGLSRVVLAHLSETNNTPELARAAYEKANGKSRPGRELLIAEQRSPTPLFDV
jgi:phosphoribosyl 1,2-cyclic phosphodiesterase